VRRRLDTHESNRAGAIDALTMVQTDVERLQRRITATVPPAIEAARSGGMLEKYAVLATRVRALEEQFWELSVLAVDTYTAMKELIELMKRDLE
jgi:hypothetical protein